MVSVNHLHRGIFRKECNKYFLATIFYFTSIFSNLCQFVGPRGLNSQNKMDFLKFFRSIGLILNHAASSFHVLAGVKCD